MQLLILWAIKQCKSIANNIFYLVTVPPPQQDQILEIWCLEIYMQCQTQTYLSVFIS